MIENNYNYIFRKSFPVLDQAIFEFGKAVLIVSLFCRNNQ
jgi:hypothetical protein